MHNSASDMTIGERRAFRERPRSLQLMQLIGLRLLVDDDIILGRRGVCH